MEQATKFFQDFNTGLKEIINISDEIKSWFSYIDISELGESQARNYLLNKFSKEYANLITTEYSLWYESKENLGLTWIYYSKNNEYVFIVNGYYFDDDENLKSKFHGAEGWKVIPYI